MTPQDITQLANCLSNADMADLLNHFTDRIFFHDSSENISDELKAHGYKFNLENPACLNGSFIQVNIEIDK